MILEISQNAYIEKVLERFSMLDFAFSVTLIVKWDKFNQNQSFLYYYHI